jgi:hypothetical protein
MFHVLRIGIDADQMVRISSGGSVVTLSAGRISRSRERIGAPRMDRSLRFVVVEEAGLCASGAGRVTPGFPVRL